MTSLHLSYVPLANSQHVYLNGLELERDLWTFDEDANSVVLGAAGHLPDDRLECRYAHTGELAPPPDVIPVDAAAQTGPNPTLTDFDPPAADDLLLVVVGIQTGTGSFIDTPSGFSLYETIAQGTLMFRIFTKLADGGETSIPISASAATSVSDRTTAALLIVRGGTILDVATDGTASSPTPIALGSGYHAGQLAVSLAMVVISTVSGRVGNHPSPYTTQVAVADGGSGTAPVQSGNGKISIGIGTWQSDGNDNPAGVVAATGSVILVRMRTFRVGVA